MAARGRKGDRYLPALDCPLQANNSWMHVEPLRDLDDQRVFRIYSILVRPVTFRAAVAMKMVAEVGVEPTASWL